MDDAQFVAALRAELVTRLGAERYELWFATQTQLCVEGDRLVVRPTSAFVRDWLCKNFAGQVAAAAAAVAGRAMAVDFEVEANASQATRLSAVGCQPSAKQEGRRTVADGRQILSNRPSEIRAPKLRPVSTPISSPSKRPPVPTFDQFATGPSNEYAFRTAELTGRGLQQASPVLFCGSTGVGKTHILRAIQGAYRSRHPRSLAVYMTAEQFTSGFVDALRGSGLPSFRQKCRGADLLLIDDLQFFLNKERTVEELHHTIDTLVTAGRQIVLASDRGLAELRGLGPELTSRLAGGLVCEISPPEFATRLAVLRQLCRDMNLEIEEDVLEYIATQITASPRELRGALHRLQAVSSAWQRPITRELAESAIADLVRQSTRAVRLADVEQAVCDVFGVEGTTLRSDRKGRNQSEPRMLAMWLARKYTRAAWSEIGEFFGRRSHSTAISAHRRVEKLITSRAQIGVNDAKCNVEEAIRRLETALRTA